MSKKNKGKSKKEDKDKKEEDDSYTSEESLKNNPHQKHDASNARRQEYVLEETKEISSTDLKKFIQNSAPILYPKSQDLYKQIDSQKSKLRREVQTEYSSLEKALEEIKNEYIQQMQYQLETIRTLIDVELAKQNEERVQNFLSRMQQQAEQYLTLNHQQRQDFWNEVSSIRDQGFLNDFFASIEEQIYQIRASILPQGKFKELLRQQVFVVSTGIGQDDDPVLSQQGKIPMIEPVLPMIDLNKENNLIGLKEFRKHAITEDGRLDVLRDPDGRDFLIFYKYDCDHECCITCCHCCFSCCCSCCQIRSKNSRLKLEELVISTVLCQDKMIFTKALKEIQNYKKIRVLEIINTQTFEFPPNFLQGLNDLTDLTLYNSSSNNKMFENLTESLKAVFSLTRFRFYMEHYNGQEEALQRLFYVIATMTNLKSFNFLSRFAFKNRATIEPICDFKMLKEFSMKLNSINISYLCDLVGSLDKLDILNLSLYQTQDDEFDQLMKQISIKCSKIKSLQLGFDRIYKKIKLSSFCQLMNLKQLQELKLSITESSRDLINYDSVFLLSIFKDLTKFRLDVTKIDDKLSQILTNQISQCRNLQKVYLSEYPRPEIFQQIKPLVHLSELHIEYEHPCTKNIMKDLTESLKSKSSLQKLFLKFGECDQVDDDLFSEFANTFAHKESLESLIMIGSKLDSVSDKSFMRLVENVLKNPKIISFEFIFDTIKEITGQSVDVLIDSIIQAKKTLSNVRLQLFSNSNVTPSTIDYVIEKIPEMSHLYTFILELRDLPRVQNDKLAELRKKMDQNFNNDISQGHDKRSKRKASKYKDSKSHKVYPDEFTLKHEFDF